MQFKILMSLACLALCSASSATDAPDFCASFGGLAREELETRLWQMGDRVRATNEKQVYDPNTTRFLNSLDRMGQDYSRDDVYDEVQQMCSTGNRGWARQGRDLAARQGTDIVKQLLSAIIGGLGTWG